MKNRFNFFIPAEFEKGQDEKGQEVMRVKGVASTNDRDSEEEILEPTGYDLQKFLSTGFINYNHLAKSDASKIIGEPEVANITDRGELYVEGRLYNTPMARSVYELTRALQEEGSSRKLGWSIEGRAIERDPANPKRITKAEITGVAITPSPVNSNTYVDLCKGTQKKDFVDLEFGNENLGGKTYLLEYEDESGATVRVNRDMSIKITKKSMDTEDSRKLAKESLDKRTFRLRDWDYIYKAYEEGKVGKEILQMIADKIRSSL